MQEIKRAWKGVQQRPGGWFKVPGDDDPAATVAGLVERVEALEAQINAQAEPKPEPRRKPRKRSTKRKQTSE